MKQEDNALVSRFAMEVVAALAVVAFGATAIWGAADHDIGWSEAGPGSGYMPFYVGVLIVAGGLGILVQTLAARRGLAAAAFVTRAQLRRIAGFALPLVLYVGASALVGLYVASVVYLFAVMAVQGRYRLWLAGLVSLGTAAFFFVLFEWWFRVPLLKGPVEAWLGIH